MKFAPTTWILALSAVVVLATTTTCEAQQKSSPHPPAATHIHSQRESKTDQGKSATSNRRRSLAGVGPRRLPQEKRDDLLGNLVGDLVTPKPAAAPAPAPATAPAPDPAPATAQAPESPPSSPPPSNGKKELHLKSTLSTCTLIFCPTIVFFCSSVGCSHSHHAWTQVHILPSRLICLRTGKKRGGKKKKRLCVVERRSVCLLEASLLLAFLKERFSLSRIVLLSSEDVYVYVMFAYGPFVRTLFILFFSPPFSLLSVSRPRVCLLAPGPDHSFMYF